MRERRARGPLAPRLRAGRCCPWIGPATAIASLWVSALALSACASSPQTEAREAPGPDRLDPFARAAYLSEDPDRIRVALHHSQLSPGFRAALELSAPYRPGGCPTRQLDALLAETPSWVAHLERGACAADEGDVREALEHFVWAVDLSSHPDEAEYVLLRVCRAADETGQATFQAMCVGRVAPSRHAP